MKLDKYNLPYSIDNLERENKKFYISADDNEISEMLNSLNLNNLEQLYDSIDDNVKFETNHHQTATPMTYEENLDSLIKSSKLNNIYPSFIGDSLRSYKTAEIVPYVCGLRGLTTAYTPYQPERSQGTLWSLWFYSNIIAKITGFEAINASLYDRSTALFEAALSARKISKHKGSKFLVSQSLHPNDLEVLETLSRHTKLEIDYAPLDESSGTTNLDTLKEMCSSQDYYAIAFSQTNNLGNIEEFDQITDIAQQNNMTTICDIDLMEINNAGLKKPSEFGKNQEGVDIIIGEGQHLALGPNFGGPGLGIFGVRYNQKQKLNIRSTPGRFIGKTTDANGNLALCMVLSTREQHIRREKATSNICSNQSFVATIVGAALLEKGTKGLELAQKTAHENLKYFVNKLKEVNNINIPFGDTSALNQLVINITSPLKATELINKASDQKIHLGVDVTDRLKNLSNSILVSFNDIVTKNDIDNLIKFLQENLGSAKHNSVNEVKDIDKRFRGLNHAIIPNHSLEKLKAFYHQLSKLNVSPDDNIYPLGSCTMKYNPHINDFTASLSGFTGAHPQAPQKDTQGCLEVLFNIQERFKEITGLPGVTTQPVAGAQGELVGIKMFQAYHQDKNEIRDIILIPQSAHGTNPATATMAGIDTYKKDGVSYGIIPIEANEKGQINLEQVSTFINQYGKRIIGVMVTNPNTSGIFEQNFKAMADMIHEIDGLVYMDGANMNAIAGIVNLDKLGVDAVHNNLHKTWTIPHGGGGPGDAIVAVSKKLVDYLPGHQVQKQNNKYEFVKTKKSIGSFHRNHGNFAHKVRCLTYLNSLGDEGVRKMSSVAVLSSCYLFNKLKTEFPTLPYKTESIDRMHEFIITLSEETFKKITESGVAKSQAISKLGKLFLDFGIHAPTVSFPEPFGLMIEPTESYSKKELDKFYEVLIAIKLLLNNNPEVLHTVPHFTPVKKVDEVKANKELIISDDNFELPQLNSDDISPKELSKLTPNDVCEYVIKKHQTIQNK